MFTEYVAKSKKEIITADAKENINKTKLVIKENHNKIEKELDLENEIEVLNNNINKNKNNKDCYQKLKHDLFKFPKMALIIAVLIYFVVAVMRGFASWPIANEILSSGYITLAITEGALYALFVMPITISNCILNKVYKKDLNKLNISLEYLEQELIKKQEELQELRDSKVKTETVDDEIHKLDTNSYKEQLKNELVELYSYCKSLKKGETFNIEEYNKQRILRRKNTDN